ncbi:MAG TPA: nucleoside hydrolase [Hanamia sp.]|nr:nucleoside hydrolase [Hanamia sp.]
MKNILTAFFLLLVSTLFFVSQMKAQTKQTPVRIIFDSDMGPDYDDVGALAILHAMADKGECEILATVSSNEHSLTTAALNVLNTYFKRPGIPVGVVRENGINISCPQKWDSLIVSKYPHAIKSNSEAHDALKLYRKILAAQPDTSVTIVTVGFLTNMSNLIASKPDEFSSLSGKELVKKKVKLLVSMAGCFDDKMGTFKEFNLMKDAAASKFAFDNWPTPVIFSGFEIGEKIHTGLPITKSRISNSPVKDVFAHCIPLDKNDANGRMSWDETAVLVAVRGYKYYFEAVKGKIMVNEDGSNRWNKNGTRDEYLTFKMPVDQLQNIIDSLMMHLPRK